MNLIVQHGPQMQTEHIQFTNSNFALNWIIIQYNDCNKDYIIVLLKQFIKMVLYKETGNIRNTSTLPLQSCVCCKSSRSVGV